MNRPVEPLYPSSAEVDDIPTPSFVEAFNYADDKQQQANTTQQILPSSRCTSVNSLTGVESSRSEQRVPTASVSSSAVHPPSNDVSGLENFLENEPTATSSATAATSTSSRFEAPNPVSTVVPERQMTHPLLPREFFAGSTTSTNNNNHNNTTQRLQVTPEVSFPLHGSEETLKAMHENSLASTFCISCGCGLFCVEYAMLVVCPSCQVISPNHRYRPNASRHGQHPGVAWGLSHREYERYLDEEELDGGETTTTTTILERVASS